MANAGTRAAIYLRVSTVKQAEADLSIPDQQRQCELYCQRHGLRVVVIFTEPGASATDDRRPVFQDMIAQAQSRPRPFDTIIVHSYSRFFRDDIQSELYIRRLKRAGVGVIAIAQDVGEGSTADLTRRMIGVIDEWNSKENAKHTLRAMKENARLGYWNGSPPPFGYDVVDVERRGDKVKKKLAINPPEATTVRVIFDLYLHGLDGLPMGTKAIADYLNRKGIRARKGGRFSVSFVHRILSRETYAGWHTFNCREAKTHDAKPTEELVRFEVPAIVSPEHFAVLRAKLAANDPQKTPPRAVTGPIVLTGLAKCATCGGGMTLRTGKGNHYRYYTCSTAAHLGKSACKGRTVRMADLDRTVIDAVCEVALTPARLAELAAGAAARQRQQAAGGADEVAALSAELRQIKKGRDALLALVEAGTLGMDDDVLKARINASREREGEVLAQLGRAQRRRDQGMPTIPAAKMERLAALMRDRLRVAEPERVRAYLRLFVGHVEVDDTEVRIAGPNAPLKAVACSGQPEPPTGKFAVSSRNGVPGATKVRTGLSALN